MFLKAFGSLKILKADDPVLDTVLQTRLVASHALALIAKS